MLPRDLPFLAYSSRSSRICSRTWLGLGLGLGLGFGFGLGLALGLGHLLADRREVRVAHHAVELRDGLLHLLEGHIRLQARSHRVAGWIT